MACSGCAKRRAAKQAYFVDETIRAMSLEQLVASHEKGGVFNRQGIEPLHTWKLSCCQRLLQLMGETSFTSSLVDKAKAKVKEKDMLERRIL